MEHIGVEIEKKYIIEKPSEELLRLQKNFSESDILQVYLRSDSGVTRRARARTSGGVTAYTETKKLRIDKMSATEIERDISKSEFATLCMDIRDGSRPIKKTRYTFIYKEQLFELDFYPEWQHTAIMETELERRDSTVEFPSFIHIIKDVTGIKEYSNSAMANNFPSEKCK